MSKLDYLYENISFDEIKTVVRAISLDELKILARDLARIVKNNYGSWVDFTEAVNYAAKKLKFQDLEYQEEKIDKNTLVGSFNAPNKDFENLINNKTSGIRKSREFWVRLIYVLVFIRDGGKRGGTKIETDPSKKLCINIGIFPTQDAVLPIFFLILYGNFVEDIRYWLFGDWNDGLDSFKKKSEVDLALHNFSTVIAHNSSTNTNDKLVFFPLFTFKGYRLFVKKESIHQIREIVAKQRPGLTLPQDINHWKDDYKRQLLMTANIVLETKSDFEWVVEKFCKILGCDSNQINEMKRNITHFNTNDGKIEFLRNKYYGIYCTNPAHAIDLTANHSEEVERFVIDSRFDHENINGLICREEYYKRNKEAIHEVINCWFRGIGIFEKLVNRSGSDDIPPPRELSYDYYYRYHDPRIIHYRDFIEKMTNYKISFEQLSMLFRHSNTFFKNSTQAREFMEAFMVNNNNNYRNNSKEIASIQASKEVDEISDEQLIHIIEHLRPFWLEMGK